MEEGTERHTAPAVARQFFPSASTTSAPAKKKAKVADDLSSDLSYCAEEQQHIDDSIDEVMKKERLKHQHREYHEHNYLQDYSMKRVYRKKKENKNGCWGTVIHAWILHEW